MRTAILVPALLLLVAAGGCSSGPKLAKVSGKVTNGGKSLLPDPKGGITLVFHPADDPTKTTFPGLVDSETGTYVVNGPDGKGIPVGKYKVSLNLMIMQSSPVVNRLNEKFADGKTPIEVEVTGSGEPIDIDVAKYR